MTAVMRRAEAVLQAFIMIRSSIRPSLMSFGFVDCSMNTRRVRSQSSQGRDGSLGLSKMHSWREMEICRTIFVSNRFANRHAGLLVRVLKDHNLCELNPESVHTK